MLIFSGALFIYAGLTALTKEIILPRRYKVSAQTGDKKLHAVKIAKVIAILACAPLIAGGVGLFAGDTAAAIIVCVLLVAAIWTAVIVFRKSQ